MVAVAGDIAGISCRSAVEMIDIHPLQIKKRLLGPCPHYALLAESRVNESGRLATSIWSIRAHIPLFPLLSHAECVILIL